MTHLGRGKTVEELLFRFITALETKLRGMKFSPVRVGREQELRWDVNAYLRMRPYLDGFRSDKASAEALGPDYLREAGVKAVEEAYRREREGALHLLAGVLTSWRIVDALATAFVQALSKQPKHTERDADDSTKEFPLRCLIHLAPAHPIRLDHTELVREYMDKIADEFGPSKVQVEDAGWMLGQLISADGVHGTPDGVFMIVRVENADTALALLVFLKSCCAGKVSLAHLFNEDQTSRLNTGADQPGIDPLETH